MIKPVSQLRRTTSFGSAIFVLLIANSVRLAVAQSPDAKIDYAREIQPILANHCWSCHGPDETSRKADLRLDFVESAMAASAIVPGDTEASELLQRICSTDQETLMPPAASKKPLTEKQKELLRLWIQQGATFSKHWAFETPQRPIAPAKLAEGVVHNDIDRYVLERLAREQLPQSSEADQGTLLRRVTLDLTGLPPSVDELNRFLSDTSANAYENAVDRLLASEHYAERMAMNWLDLARYADTNGYNNDEDRSMWPWRDWVIRAFHSNMPYDQFIVNQLAGDLLPNPTRDQLIATGFLRNQGHNTEGGIIAEEYRVEYVADRVHTTATVFLGLSMQCARCHDHKFDPISQSEYYQFFAFFNNLDEKQANYSKFVGAEPFIRVPTPDQETQIKKLSDEIAALQASLKDRDMRSEELMRKWIAEHSKAEFESKLGITALHRFAFEETNLSEIVDAVATNNSGAKAGLFEGKPARAPGKKGNAIELDGSSSIQLGNTAEFDGTQPFSISVWVKPASNEGMAILSKMDEADNFRGFDLLLEGGKVAVHMVHQWPGNAIKVVSKQTVDPNKWQHVAMAYDGGKTAGSIKLYVDGKPLELDITQNSLSESIANTKPFRIGLREKSLPFRGLIDELQVFRGSLGPEQVQQLNLDQPLTSIADWIQLPSDKLSDAQRQELTRLYRTHIDTEYATLQKDEANKKKELATVEEQTPAVMILKEMATPRETFVLKRGQYDQPSVRVSAKLPAIFQPVAKEENLGRLELAKWLVDANNPLTARVVVNRWWQNYFGTGLVKTAEDFGITGESPSHAELLDYLAIRLIDSGWNVKELQKLIVMSATYRQASRVSPQLLDLDPENRLLARGPRFRLAAETVRDNALAISGLLQGRVGGPSVKPYQPAGLWEDVTVERRGKYVADSGEGLYRRSMYTFWKRTCPPPSMMSFDAPNREVCLARRARTNTPLQSLVLLNDPTYVEAARNLATNIIRNGGQEATSRIKLAYQSCVARNATEQEQRIVLSILAQAREKYSSNPKQAADLVATGASPVDSTIDPVELASWTIVASTLLNLDETISKR